MQLGDARGALPARGCRAVENRGPGALTIRGFHGPYANAATKGRSPRTQLLECGLQAELQASLLYTLGGKARSAMIALLAAAARVRTRTSSRRCSPGWTDADPAWRRMADGIAALCLDKFIDPRAAL